MPLLCFPCSFLSQTTHLLDEDDSLYCISAWNDQASADCFTRSCCTCLPPKAFLKGSFVMRVYLCLSAVYMLFLLLSSHTFFFFFFNTHSLVQTATSTATCKILQFCCSWDRQVCVSLAVNSCVWMSGGVRIVWSDLNNRSCDGVIYQFSFNLRA